jgi:predicted CXXCH cytochrome family protein
LCLKCHRQHTAELRERLRKSQNLEINESFGV